MLKISRYFTGALEELHHVRWPTRQQAIRLSIIVIGFVAISTIVFGAIDYILSQVVNIILSSV
ncbi:MAG: preprotein translocase subunit SecE [Candidatus Peribacteraceae bacterium]|nr:preprotein translocase subunit SecE [Candidatus Peribacteraceae bacterium]